MPISTAGLIFTLLFEELSLELVRRQFGVHHRNMKKKFDANFPLVALHVPKCGGQSLTVSIYSAQRAHYNVVQFYPDIGIYLPPDWSRPRTIVLGHFLRWKGQAVEDIAPATSPQFTTVLRNPFETLVSGYFYGIREGQEWAQRHTLDSYLDWYIKAGVGPLTGGLPDRKARDSVESYLENFVSIGVVEKLGRYVGEIGKLLGADLTPPPHVNASERFQNVPDREAEIKRAFPFDYELYRYAALSS
jgi:hypothetical protein